MTDPRLIEQRIDAVVESLGSLLESEGEARAEARAGLKDSLRALIEAVSQGAPQSAFDRASATIDRDTIRRVIAPELERHWTRQGKDLVS